MRTGRFRRLCVLTALWLPVVLGGTLLLSMPSATPGADEGGKPAAPPVGQGAGAAPAGPGAPAGAQAPAATPARPADPGRAIDRGLNWLLTRQNPDGGYGPSVFVPGT